MAALNIETAKNKLKELVAVVESIQDKPSGKRPDKCLMCSKPYGPFDAKDPRYGYGGYQPTFITAKCGHTGVGSRCCDHERGEKEPGDKKGLSFDETTCGRKPKEYDCYECRLKKHPSVCLMCNQPYGGPIVKKKDMTRITAKCGHHGDGYQCADEPITQHNPAVDICACNLVPERHHCFACRTS